MESFIKIKESYYDIHNINQDSIELTQLIYSYGPYQLYKWLKKGYGYNCSFPTSTVDIL